ncbi:MAG TPA: hypothetical protein VD713_04295, partial [Sphingomonadales bacterium]|nr:hypothetical protein [Sphingomonadales bacterium]
AFRLSALTGEGVERLLMGIAKTFDGHEPEVSIAPGENGKARAWLYRHGSILGEKGGVLRLRLSAKAIGQFAKEFPEIPLKIKRKLKKTA